MACATEKRKPLERFENPGFLKGVGSQVPHLLEVHAPVNVIVEHRMIWLKVVAETPPQKPREMNQWVASNRLLDESTSRTL